MNWVTTIEIIGTATMLGAALGGYFKYLNKNAMIHARSENELLDAQLKLLIRENKTNGGSSMKDQLDRIEHDLSYVNLKLDTHINWHMKGGM